MVKSSSGIGLTIWNFKQLELFQAFQFVFDEES